MEAVLQTLTGDVLKSSERNGIRVISTAVLKEIGLGVFPANSLTTVTAVTHDESTSAALSCLSR